MRTMLLLAFLCWSTNAFVAPVNSCMAARYTNRAMTPVAEQSDKAPRVPGSRVVRFTGKATGQAVRATGKVTSVAVRATGKAAARIVRPVLRPFARPSRMATVELFADSGTAEVEEIVGPSEARIFLLETRPDVGEFYDEMMA